MTKALYVSQEELCSMQLEHACRAINTASDTVIFSSLFLGELSHSNDQMGLLSRVINLVFLISHFISI